MKPIDKRFSGTRNLHIRFHLRDASQRPAQQYFALNRGRNKHFAKHVIANRLENVTQVVFARSQRRWHFFRTLQSLGLWCFFFVIFWIGIELANDGQKIWFIWLELLSLVAVSIIVLHFMVVLGEGDEMRLRGLISKGELDELMPLFREDGWLGDVHAVFGTAIREIVIGWRGLILGKLIFDLFADLHSLFIN